MQFPVVEDTVFTKGELGALYADFFCKSGKFGPGHFFVNDNNSVVEIPALDYAYICEFFNFAQKAKGTAWGKIIQKLFFKVKKPGMLRPEGRVFVVNHYGSPEAVERQGNDIHVVFRVMELYGFIDHKVVLRLILFGEPGGNEGFCKLH